MLSPAQLLVGLADSLGVLGGRAPSMSATRPSSASIAWSHSLLADAARTVFRRLGVFASPSPSKPPSRVVAGDGGAPTACSTELEHLIDQSLVQMDDLGARRASACSRPFASSLAERSTTRETAAHRRLATPPTSEDGPWDSGRSSTTVWPTSSTTADAEYGDLVAMLSHLERYATPEDHAEVAMACLPAIGVRHLAEVVALGDAVADRLEPTSVLGGHLHLRLALADPTMPVHVQLALAAAEATNDPELRALATYWEPGGRQARRRAGRRGDLRPARDRPRDAGEEHFSRIHWAVAALHRGMGRHTEAIQHSRRSIEDTACPRCNVMVWSEAALLALVRGDLGAAEAALERAKRFALQVRDAGFSAHVRLTEVEVAAYAGKPWPAPEIEADRQADGDAATRS